MGAIKPVGFWGLVVEPDRMYSQVVPVSFKVTMAALGPVPVINNSSTGSMASPGKASSVPVQKRSVLMLTHQKDGEFALCSLAPENQPNQTLDLVFLEGETIHFRVVGEQAIHLTGYYFEDADESAGAPFGGGYDSEEIEAELNGEDIEDTDSERDGEEEEDEEEEEETNEEVDSDMADFIDDEELAEDEVSDSETATETEDEKSETEVRRKKALNRKLKSHPRIKEVTSDEGEEDEDEDDEERDFEVLSVSEDSQVEHSDEDDEDDEDDGEDEEEYDEEDDEDDEEDDEDDEEDDEEDEEESEDEEVDSDEAGSVDMSPGRKASSKKSPHQPETAKRTKIEITSQEKKTASSSMISPAASSPAAGSPAKGTTPNGKNKTLPSGLQIEDIKMGAGIKAQKGRRVTISYTMLASGKTSTSSPAASGTFQFNLGDADVAKGVAIGVQGMALGGERRLVIPASMIDEKTRPALPKSGNCILHIKLDAVQPAPKSS